MSDLKTTAGTAKALIRSGIGHKLELTETDMARIQARKDEQAARLARIAARQTDDAQTAKGKIQHECAECGKGYVTRDELMRHEIVTDHDVERF